ncbi:MAG: type I phosphomannose isomerase catalytic subunit [Edaphobacter sp.]
MNQTRLYPLRFEPIYQYRPWGGRRLANILKASLPDGPIGESWILSDREDHPSLVANGPLKGQSIGQVMKQSQGPLMGRLSQRFHRFPLLLKFLDAHEMLSIQVHPGYSHADIPPAKTEAWVVLEAGIKSRIDVGLKAGTTAIILRQSVKDGTLSDHLVSITPNVGDGVFIPAGTVHSLGDDVVVFEVQQNSDVTFRLYDWGHVDAKTGKPRELQVDQALACTDFVDGKCGLVVPAVESENPVKRERLFDCDAFQLWRLRGELTFTVGAEDEPRVLVCISGAGQIEQGDETYSVRKGEVWLLPAEVGACTFKPHGAATLLEIAIPDVQGVDGK